MTATTIMLTSGTPVAIPLGPEILISAELFEAFHKGTYNHDYVSFECVKKNGIGDVLRVIDGHLNRYVYVVSGWETERTGWWARWPD